MIDATAPPAPTPPATPTISAERAAANSGDLNAFTRAHDASRKGQPLPEVVAPKTTPDADTPAEAKPLSRRQQDVNDRIREGVEAATATLRAELAALKEQQIRREPPPVAPKAEPPAAAEPEYKRYAKMANAPKLNDFESVEEHTAAMSHFIAKTMLAEQRADASTHAESARRDQEFRERAESYGGKLAKAKEADPDIASKIHPAILQAIPSSALERGTRVTFANVVAEVGMYSAHPAELYVSLSTADGKPSAEALRIAALTPEQWQAELYRLDGRIASGAISAVPPAAAASAPESAPPSTVTHQPPPPPTLTKARTTTDPKAAALARGDFATWNRLDLAERIDARKGA